jgi:DNA-binding HxlR family transcriptional regulator
MSNGTSVAAAEIVVSLDRCHHTFTSLKRSIRCPSEAILAAALSQLTDDGLVKRDGSRFGLTAKGRDLVKRCRPRRGQGRRH